MKWFSAGLLPGLELLQFCNSMVSATLRFRSPCDISFLKSQQGEPLELLL